MLRDKSCDLGRQMIATGQPQALRGVPDDDLGAGPRIQLLVRVLSVSLVLRKKVRPQCLANIVIVGTHAREKRVGPDGFRRTFGHVGNEDGMMICTRCLDQQLTKERVCGTREFHELERGGYAEHAPGEGIGHKGKCSG